MRVLYVSKALCVAAYRRKLSDLAAHVEVRAVMPTRWGRTAPEPGDDARVDRIPALLHGHNHLHVYRGIGRTLDAFEPTFVHIDEEPYSAVTAQLVRACARRRIPCVFFAWQNIAKALPAPFNTLRRYVFDGAHGAIAGTDEAAAVITAAGWDGPTAVIPQFGVDPDQFVPDPRARMQAAEAIGAQRDDLIVGYAGRLVPEKGVHDLISALAPVERTHLVIMGEGPLRAALERSAQAEMPGRVHFTGAAPSWEMPRRLAALDVLVLPSRTTSRWKEQFGRVLVEAMACGVPVVGSDSGEIPRVIGDAGIVIPEGDVSAWSAALACLRDAPHRRAELGARGRDRVKCHFTGARIAQRTAAFYREVECAR